MLLPSLSWEAGVGKGGTEVSGMPPGLWDIEAAAFAGSGGHEMAPVRAERSEGCGLSS